MELFELCKKTLNGKQNDVKEDDQGQDMVISENELLYHSSVPAICSNEVWAQLLTTSVYYISDLHLTHHIIKSLSQNY